MHWHRRSTFELLACQRRQQADTNGPPLVPVVHGVETRETVAVYRTFWALLDLVDPSRFLRLEDEKPALEADPELTAPSQTRCMCLQPSSSPLCAADARDHYIVASGKADLACRITHMPEALFA